MTDLNAHSHDAEPNDQTPSGDWPRNLDDLPVLIDQRQLARLLRKSVRTLERHRGLGCSIPFKKLGRTVFYARDDVRAFIESRSFRSTSEARAARQT